MNQGYALNYLPSFWANGLWLFLGFFIIYVLGHIIVSWGNFHVDRPFTNVFNKVSLGNFALIIFYSLYMTRLKSISLLFIILCGYYLFLLYKEEGYRLQKPRWIHLAISKAECKAVFTAIPTLLFLYLLAYFFIYSPVSDEVYSVGGDNFAYARYLQHLNFLRIENISLDWLNLAGQSPSPYHYADLWHPAFFSKLFGISPAYAMQLISTCLLYLTIYFGGAALIENYFEASFIYTFPVAGTLLFSSGVVNYIPHRYKDLWVDWFDYGIWSVSKYTLIFVLLIHLFLAIRKKKHLYFSCALLSIVIVFPIVPTIGLFIICFTFYLYKYEEVKITVLARRLVLPFFFVVGYFGMFYFLSNASSDPRIISTQEILRAYFSIENIRTQFNIFAGALIKIAANLILFAVVSVIIIKRETLWRFKGKTEAAFVVLMIISGLVSYTLLSISPDSFQMLLAILLPLMSIGVFLLMNFWVFKTERKILNRLLIGVMIVFFIIKTPWLFNNVDRVDLPFYKNILNEIEGEDLANKVGYIYGPDDYIRGSIFSKNSDMNFPAQFLLYQPVNYNPYCLSPYDIPLDGGVLFADMEKRLISKNVFYRYCEDNKKKRVLLDVSEMQIKFIRETGIKYLFISPNARSNPFIENFISTEFKDNKGLRFCILKY